MRYIIIPLVIILYILWTIAAIKDYYTDNHYGDLFEDWKNIHIALIIAIFFTAIFVISIVYW